MSLAHSILLAVRLLDPGLNPEFPRAEPAFTSEGRLVRTSRGTLCIDGPHHPHRVHKLPSAPATSSGHHREPTRDSYVHCSAETLERERLGAR
ncbi:hypothetical protein [Chelatococcus reniformis]|uniref:Uncharacterized protein n=1 Tax=Chelatococcus reniformis TaxID=1494448 RepID=A0A916UHL7_9HYPH|nr:hypothetical protein [Chelatococcus reniformis]GGC72528.1 hypothetical protein GCM10010994_33670 [Chelatococcus reniformis]